MSKENRSKLIKVLIAVVVFIALFLGIRELTKPKIEVGSKTVEITIIDASGEDETVVHEGTYKTDAELLSDLLEELSKNGDITLELQGNKSDAYGRSIVMMMDLKTEDWNNGPWWVFDSTTNSDCLTAGFCSGIDFTPVYDNDIFFFRFISSFE